MKRIRKADSLNWVIEEFVEGGEIATRGRTAGKPKAARWIILGHYNNLENAAKGMLLDCIGDYPHTTGQEILEAITKAKEEVIKTLQNENQQIRS